MSRTRSSVGVRVAALATPALALLACASDPAAQAPPSNPAVRVRVELLGGFPVRRDPLPEARVALLVDATASMRTRSAAGSPRLSGARAAAQRFATSLPISTPLALFVLGDDPAARCETPPSAREGERDELLASLERTRANGEGSLARALRALPGPDVGGYERVVAVSGLEDGCGEDLCEAAQELAARGVRLDLVRIGNAPLPECLAAVTRPEPERLPLAWSDVTRVGFHVERTGRDPAILVCGESGGLPVEFASGNADVVVKFDPPLRIGRNFMPGTRWILQVLDFPDLDPPERQWRWLAEPAAVAEGGEPR